MASTEIGAPELRSAAVVMGIGDIANLAADDCWRLLRSTSIGRIAVSAVDSVDIFPVNFAVNGHSIVFRTAPGTKLLELAINDRVAFEIDAYDDHQAWSVVVKGHAERIERQSDVDALEQLDLAPWIPTLKYRWVRVRPVDVTGRQFVLGAEPERF